MLGFHKKQKRSTDVNCNYFTFENEVLILKTFMNIRKAVENTERQQDFF